MLTDSWILNQKMPISITVNRPTTFPTSVYPMEFLLNVKGVSHQQIELKCLELETKIKGLIFDLFFNERPTSLPNPLTRSRTGNGQRSTASLGLKAQSPKSGGRNNKYEK